MTLEEIEKFIVKQKEFFQDEPFDLDTTYILMEKLLAVAKAAKAMQQEAFMISDEDALKGSGWYTFLPCQYAERIDDALEELESE